MTLHSILPEPRELSIDEIEFVSGGGSNPDGLQQPYGPPVPGPDPIYNPNPHDPLFYVRHLEDMYGGGGQKSPFDLKLKFKDGDFDGVKGEVTVGPVTGGISVKKNGDFGETSLKLKFPF